MMVAMMAHLGMEMADKDKVGMVDMVVLAVLVVAHNAVGMADMVERMVVVVCCLVILLVVVCCLVILLVVVYFQVI